MNSEEMLEDQTEMASSSDSAEEKQQENEVRKDEAQLNGCEQRVSDDNSSVSLDRTAVIFDATLPPGVAPEGFVILDEASNLDDASPVASPQPEPLFRLTFRDELTFQNYYEKIEDFLKYLLQRKNHGKDKIKSTTKDLVLEIFDLDESDSNNFLFTVDTEPKLKDDLDIPMYGKKFNKALEKSIDEAPEISKDKFAAPKMTCFNCLGNHSLRDCPEPPNYVTINKNKKDYYNLRRGPTSSNSRYHLDNDQKFGHFVPGKISSNLQKALGLKADELPRHIYRMRFLGYPPGWLEEAKLQHSGLTLFNSDGIADGGSDEEGEIISPGDKDQYDIRKIIDFPGFNVLPPQGIRDECEQYWGSENQENYSKTAMVAFLSHKKAEDGYKRKKLPNSNIPKNNSAINPGEMELDTVEDTSVECVPVKNLFVPPLPKENDLDLPPPPPPPPEESSQFQEESCSNESMALPSQSISPTLFDLECAKNQLLAELNDSQSQGNNDSSKTEKSELTCSDKVIPSNKSENSTLSQQNVISNETNINSETPKNSPQSNFGSAHKTVKAVHFGTPILHSCSPYRRLPSSEKFSKDICDVINFENLPDSTGKYDQMTELLHKVRRTLSDLHKE